MRRWMFILACLLAWACSDESYRGNADDRLVGKDAYPVLVSVGIPDSMIETKGTGAIDLKEGWAWGTSPIYIYSFKRDLLTSFETKSEENDMWCLVDGSKDKSGSKAGKCARVNELDSYVLWEGDKNLFYYPDSQPYDFYAYFIDDFVPDEDGIERTADAVIMDVTIDGSMDLMSSVAKLTDEQLDKESFSEEDRKNIIDCAFSAYTANREIYPVLHFRHHLTRLRFEIYPGEKKAGNVYVENISVMSRTKAKFTVAHKSPDMMGADFSADKGRGRLFLTETDGKPLRDDWYHPSSGGDWKKDVYDRAKVTVGGSLLVAPDTEYLVRFDLKEVLPSGLVRRNSSEFVLGSGTGTFEAGKQYTVRAAIYGLSDVVADVVLVPWGYGGTIVLDPEDELE